MQQKEKGLALSGVEGFTLIEVLIVMGIIAILATVVLVAINPARQFAQARDSQRLANINTILNAIGQRMVDNKGVFAGTFVVGGTTYTCGDIPLTESPILTDGVAGCLVPTYFPSFPVDPTTASGTDTGYNIYQDTNGRVHIKADAPETTIRNTFIEVVR